MIPELETKRLILRPLELADADQIQILFPQWEIVRYLARRVPWPYPPDGALTFIRDSRLTCDRARRLLAMDAALEEFARAFNWKHQSTEE